MSKIIIQAVIKGIGSAIGMLTVFFLVVTFISGWTFTISQFSAYWYFIVSLALGFGIQIGLYSYLKQAVSHDGAPKVVIAISGTTSTAAMISCCAHYLANILPILGVTGFISIIGQYQVELFWVGIVFNVGGIAFIGQKIIAFNRHMKQMSLMKVI
ncbi:MAG: hypothetical protein HZB09_02355 [Candidatus Yonathbacteria bacterium]|nr:hypothetical protein [Candidatus Yonathbacteria bacterium]